jgi:Family of unknown function (DUF5681)
MKKSEIKELIAAIEAPDNTGDQQVATQFKPGKSGNPAGRPKGSRNKLSEAFISVLEASFEREGEAVINKLMKEDPKTYIKVIAALCPAKLEAAIEHHHVHEFDSAGSIDKILEMVAREAGVENAFKLAQIFEVEPPESLTDGQTLLPPVERGCPPFPEGTANYRAWYRKRYGVFPD